MKELTFPQMFGKVARDHISFTQWVKFLLEVDFSASFTGGQGVSSAEGPLLCWFPRSTAPSALR